VGGLISSQLHFRSIRIASGRDALASALGRRRVDLLAMSAVSTSRKSGNPSPMSAGKTGKPLLVLSFRGFDPKGNSGAFTRLAYRP